MSRTERLRGIIEDSRDLKDLGIKAPSFQGCDLPNVFNLDREVLPLIKLLDLVFHWCWIGEKPPTVFYDLDVLCNAQFDSVFSLADFWTRNPGLHFMISREGENSYIIQLYDPVTFECRWSMNQIDRDQAIHLLEWILPIIDNTSWAR